MTVIYIHARIGHRLVRKQNAAIHPPSDLLSQFFVCVFACNHFFASAASARETICWLATWTLCTSFLCCVNSASDADSCSRSGSGLSFLLTPREPVGYVRCCTCVCVVCTCGCACVCVCVCVSVHQCMHHLLCASCYLLSTTYDLPPPTERASCYTCLLLQYTPARSARSARRTT